MDQEVIEAICHDYAQRWFGEDWPLMDEDEKAELRIEAHRWLKCWVSVTSTDPRTLCGQIGAIYGELDPEDCAMVDREWARMRGYILPVDGKSTVLHAKKEEAK